MKSKTSDSHEKPKEVLLGAKTISFERTKEIMKDEEIEYSDEELKQVLEFISKLVAITTSHYERVKTVETKVISINTNQSTHETKSIPLYQGEHRRAS